MKLQKKHWDPLIAWTEESFGVNIRISQSLFGSDQSEETKARFAEVLRSLDEWQLAGKDTLPLSWHDSQNICSAMERTTYTTKSFLIALALVHGRIDAEEAALAAHVEVNSQIEQWGEVEDCKFAMNSFIAHRLIIVSAHDVDYQDIRRQLGSAVCFIS